METGKVCVTAMKAGRIRNWLVHILKSKTSSKMHIYPNVHRHCVNVVYTCWQAQGFLKENIIICSIFTD